MMGIPLHRLGRVGVHPRRRQGARQARDARRRDPDARLLRVQRDRVRGARRRRRRCRRSRSGSQFPIVVKPAAPGLGARDQVRPHAGRRPRGAGGGVLVRPQGAARAPRRRARPRGVGASTTAAAPRALPIVEAVPERGGLLRLRVPLRDRAHAVRLPGRARRRTSPARASEIALAGLRAARLLGLRARRPDAGGGRPASCTCSRPTRSRADRDEPAAAGGRRRRDRVRRADRADPRRRPAGAGR